MEQTPFDPTDDFVRALVRAARNDAPFPDAKTRALVVLAGSASAAVVARSAASASHPRPIGVAVGSIALAGALMLIARGHGSVLPVASPRGPISTADDPIDPTRAVPSRKMPEIALGPRSSGAPASDPGSSLPPTRATTTPATIATVPLATPPTTMPAPTKPGGPAAPSAIPPTILSAVPFDRRAAAEALGAVDVSGCERSDGPTGAGHVSVTFALDGSVSVVVVDQPPFAGTAVGACVESLFRNVHIPAFVGGPVKVGKSFVVDPGRMPRSPAAPPSPFDRGAAMSALNAVDVSGCKRPEGPAGPGQAAVWFQPDGSVGSVLVEGALVGADVGTCVVQQFRAVHVPRFAGSPVEVEVTFEIK